MSDAFENVRFTVNGWLHRASEWMPLLKACGEGLPLAGEDASNGLVGCRLGYPNREVRQSLNERLLPDASREARNIAMFEVERAA